MWNQITHPKDGFFFRDLHLTIVVYMPISLYYKYRITDSDTTPYKYSIQYVESFVIIDMIKNI